jgi:hypothetical protein
MIMIKDIKRLKLISLEKRMICLSWDIENLEHFESLGILSQLEVVALIVEFMPGASLHDHLYPCSDGLLAYKQDWDKRSHIAIGIALGLMYLHNHFHEPSNNKYLTPSNIFLDEALEPNLGRFWYSKICQSRERWGEIG